MRQLPLDACGLEVCARLFDDMMSTIAPRISLVVHDKLPELNCLVSCHSHPRVVFDTDLSSVSLLSGTWVGSIQKMQVLDWLHIKCKKTRHSES